MLITVGANSHLTLPLLDLHKIISTLSLFINDEKSQHYIKISATIV